MPLWWCSVSVGDVGCWAMNPTILKSVVPLVCVIWCMLPDPATAEVALNTEIFNEIAERLPDFNRRHRLEPTPFTGGPEHRFGRFEPEHGLMEHWGSALRVRWSLKVLHFADGRSLIIYQYISVFPDSSATPATDTTVRQWFFERSIEGHYAEIELDRLTELSPVIFRFHPNGSMSMMDDSLVFKECRWNGTRLVEE